MRNFLKTPKPDSAQESIRHSILTFYSVNGIEKTKEFCNKLLKADDHKKDKNFRSKVHGEICEALLESLLVDYIKKNKLESRWFLEKGMVIKDLDSGNKNFHTELDLTLFTPYKVVIFECKSYAGDKIIKDKCTISRSSGEFDVYKQNKNHMKVLNTNIRTCLMEPKAKAYKLALFDFSIGTLQDTRDDKYKKIMPVINTSNIDRFLDVINKQPPIWDVSKLRKVCAIIMNNNKSLRVKHLAYVKSIRH